MFKKYASLNSEFWIIDGTAVFADGDVGDYNHSRVVSEQLWEEFVEEVNSYFGLRINPEFAELKEIYNRIEEQLEEENPEKEISEEDIEKFIIEELDFDKEKLDVILDITDPRDYGLKHLGWKRVRDTSVQTWTLTPNDLKEIANGLYDAYGEEVEGNFFEIEVLSNGKLFTDVPWPVIDSGNLAEFRQFEFGYKASRRKRHVADYGGDFQNISDIRPDPGNISPKRNREYLVKQPENFTDPLTVGSEEDNGKYVHLHPKHNPRYDLRKLKIVDESEGEEDE